MNKYKATHVLKNGSAISTVVRAENLENAAIVADDALRDLCIKSGHEYKGDEIIKLKRV